MKLMWRTNQPAADVVGDVQQQTAKAAQLATIADQDRLADPRTNPAVRQHADRLRDIQHRKALEAEHTRRLRGHRVEDRRAAHAEKALQALQEAREASSAAKSVLALHSGRTRFMGIAMAASLSLSFGAATGVAEYAKDVHAPWQSGYLAEVGFTGLATAVIMYRSHLAQHGGSLTGWRNGVLWLLMVAPLAASMAANLAGAGPVGVACSVGAAAFSLLSYVIADASAAAIQDQAAKVTGEDEADLHAIAAGDDLFAAPGSGIRFAFRGAGFTPIDFTPAQQVHEPEAQQVHVEVHREPVNAAEPEARELEAGPANHDPRTTDREPEFMTEPVREPAEIEVQRTDREPRPAQKQKAQRTANLTDRAARKSAEVQQVVNLIGELGYDAVTLGVVRERCGFTKTTAYNRLTEARELVNRGDVNPKAVNQG